MEMMVNKLRRNDNHSLNFMIYIINMTFVMHLVRFSLFINKFIIYCHINLSLSQKKFITKQGGVCHFVKFSNHTMISFSLFP